MGFPLAAIREDVVLIGEMERPPRLAPLADWPGIFYDEKPSGSQHNMEIRMAKSGVRSKRSSSTKSTGSSVYRVTEIIGTSATSWEDAAKIAVETAAQTLYDLRVAEVNRLDMVIEGGKVTAYRAKVSLSFKYMP